MKQKRHDKIIELISKYDIETQEELVAKLNEAGFNATQATVSRDIRELKLSKASVDGSNQKYIVLQNSSVKLGEKYSRALKDGFIPATINYKVPDEECDLDIVPNEGRNVQVEYAISNSLGFGGHNASVLFKHFAD